MSNRLKSGRYELVRKLGEGAQGETWEAIDYIDTLARDDKRALTDRFQAFVDAGGKRGAARAHVAIKRFRVARAKSWKDVELAEREAKTLASLSHPLVPVYLEHFEEDGALYLVMEKIEGESVASMKRSSPEEVLRMLADVGEALRYLHGLAPPIIHRDIKPSNVIRRPDGRFVIVDFGAVRDRLKPQGGSTVVGTFGYMAPEQFQGRASPKSDVYGAAATALRMLTGEEPEDLPHVGLAIDVAAAVPQGTPNALIRALEAMTRPDPDTRAGSIAEALATSDAPRRARRTDGEAPTAADYEQDVESTRKGRREDRRARRRARRENRRSLVERLRLFIATIVAWLTSRPLPVDPPRKRVATPPLPLRVAEEDDEEEEQAEEAPPSRAKRRGD